MDLTALFKFSYGLYVVGLKNDGRLGGSIVDALAQASSDSPPTLILCSIKRNYTNETIKREGVFSISVLPKDVDPFVVANFGFQSSRVADKWKNVPHHLSDGLPFLDGAASFVKCRLKDAVELTTHTAFFCEVTGAENGDGEPLIFGEYQKTMKKAAYEAFEKFKASGEIPAAKGEKWECTVCGYVYSDDSPPFEELPEKWACPICRVGKELFKKI